MLKLILKCLTAFTFLSISALSYAQPSPATELKSLLNNINNMQADFTQTTVSKDNKPLQRSSGHMALLRPGNFRWDILKPNAQVIVTNGTKIWIYDKDLQQVTIRKVSKEPGDTPALLLSKSDETLDKDYSVQQLPDKKANLLWFELTPKNKNNMFVSVKLGFANHVIQQMELRDQIGHITEIRFDTVLLNSSIDPSLFNFVPPPKVDVIDETKR